jgi:acyl carrier protein
MASMTLVALVEEEFQLRIPVSEIARLTSFSEILEYVNTHAAEVGDGCSIAEGPGRD